jgi:hypothetical protein
VPYTPAPVGTLVSVLSPLIHAHWFVEGLNFQCVGIVRLAKRKTRDGLDNLRMNFDEDVKLD